MAASPAVGANAPTTHFHPDHIMPQHDDAGEAMPPPTRPPHKAGPRRSDLHYVRASGLAQARLQLAVMAGNRRRAFEQIDRLVAIDRQLERLMAGEAAQPDGNFGADLDEQRLALASEKLALTAGVEMPRQDPAFGAGMGVSLAPEEEVEIVEETALNRRLLRALWGGAALLVLCFAVAAAVLLLF